jgi:hypothetical protein
VLSLPGALLAGQTPARCDGDGHQLCLLCIWQRIADLRRALPLAGFNMTGSGLIGVRLITPGSNCLVLEKGTIIWLIER